MPDETAQAPIPLGDDIRDRIIEVRKMYGSELAPHPLNWRVHPDAQAAALRGILRQVGKVAVLTAYYSEKNGGKLTLVDGHLRTSGEFAKLEWHVAITDLTDEEASTQLLAHDNITMLAQGSVENLEALIRQSHTTDEELATFFTETALDFGIVAFPQDAEGGEAASAQDGPDFPKFEDDEKAATHVQCPSCQYKWSLTASEIAKFKLKGKKPKASKKKKGRKQESPDDAQQEAEDAEVGDEAEGDDDDS